MTTDDRLNEIDQRLAILETEFVAFRQREFENQATLTELRGLTTELLGIAQLHQQALRLSQDNQRRNDELFREMREDIQQIWQYLLGQQGNGRTQG